MSRIVPRKYSGRGKWAYANDYNSDCIHGHASGRYFSGGCKECIRLRDAKKQAKIKANAKPVDPEAVIAKIKATKAKVKAETRAEFHKRWMTERKARLKAEREERACRKLALDLLK